MRTRCARDAHGMGWYSRSVLLRAREETYNCVRVVSFPIFPGTVPLSRLLYKYLCGTRHCGSSHARGGLDGRAWWAARCYRCTRDAHGAIQRNESRESLGKGAYNCVSVLLSPNWGGTVPLRLLSYRYLRGRGRAAATGCRTVVGCMHCCRCTRGAGACGDAVEYDG